MGKTKYIYAAVGYCSSKAWTLFGAGPNQNSDEIVCLPKTITNLFELFQGHTISIFFKQKRSQFTPTQEKVWKYCGGALLNGRPLDTVMIVMAGASGAGKSTTINSLFDDPTLCRTSQFTSQTKDPVIVQKQLCVTKETPNVCGNLQFIDVPGTFDTDGRNNVLNSTKVGKFMQTQTELACRLELSQITGGIPFPFSLRETVYPNVILFVFNASDNRYVGPNTFFRKSIQALKTTPNLVDTKNPNLIIVLTHAVSIGRNPSEYSKHIKEITTNIQYIVREELGIPDVPVVPVENDGNKHMLRKVGEFYELPNRELSHCNLFESMLKLFNKNNDLLGKLFVGWYFYSDSPEKRKQADLIQPSIKITSADLAVYNEKLKKLKISMDDDYVYPTLNFLTLGCGYCPVTEQAKPINLLQSEGTSDKDEMTVETIRNTKFSVPKGVRVRVFEKPARKFHRLSFFEQEEYQRHMKESYGITDREVKLIVNASSEGRWVKNTSGSCNTSLVSLVQDVQVAKFKLDNPRKHVKCASFRKELQALPDNYSDTTAPAFQSFFAKWGSHLVYEQAVGGAITLNCTLNREALTKNKLKEVEAQVGTIFKPLVDQLLNQPQYKSLKAAGVTMEKIEIESDGGDPSIITTLQDTMKSGLLHKWSATVPEKPAELRHTIKLYPYYKFVDSSDPKYTALKQATEDYMENTLGTKHHTVRERTRQGEADRAMKEVMGTSIGCFSKGTMVQLWGDGDVAPIEDLASMNKQLRTVKLDRGTFGDTMKLDAPAKTDFCTFIDRQDDVKMDYIVLRFSNGKKLIVSEGHLIFQYVLNEDGVGGVVKGKQAKDFKVGEMAVYCNNNGKGSLEMPEIVNISREIRVGAYCPLTMSGTFIADGFLVTSYAHVDSFTVAQAAMLPLKIWCMMTKKSLPDADNYKFTGSGYLTVINGIHPFAQFLMAIRKVLCSFLPNCN